MLTEAESWQSWSGLSVKNIIGSLLQFYNAVGISPREKKKSSERAAEIALRASYTIYLSRTNKIWSDNWELVQVPKEE